MQYAGRGRVTLEAYCVFTASLALTEVLAQGRHFTNICWDQWCNIKDLSKGSEY